MAVCTHVRYWESGSCRGLLDDWNVGVLDGKTVNLASVRLNRQLDLPQIVRPRTHRRCVRVISNTAQAARARSQLPQVVGVGQTGELLHLHAQLGIHSLPAGAPHRLGALPNQTLLDSRQQSTDQSDEVLIPTVILILLTQLNRADAIHDLKALVGQWIRENNFCCQQLVQTNCSWVASAGLLWCQCSCCSKQKIL